MCLASEGSFLNIEAIGAGASTSTPQKVGGPARPPNTREPQTMSSCAHIDMLMEKKKLCKQMASGKQNEAKPMGGKYLAAVSVFICCIVYCNIFHVLFLSTLD